jgi:cyclopropane fatty-acyl-phospholipid synthase-like methyltransferase
MANLEQMREAWDRYAVGYDEAITPLSMRVAEDALRIAGVEPGTRLLDIAAGGGALSIPAARRRSAGYGLVPSHG